MKKIFVIVLLFVSFSLTGCTQPDKAYSILQREGYENISIEGYAFFSCSKDDVFRTRFTAEKNGQYVEGVICSGWMKGSTVRTFD